MSEWARTLVVGAGGFVGASLRDVLGGLVYRVQEGLVTVEKATVISYRAGDPPAGE